MNLDLARTAVTSDIPEEVSASLKVLADQGSLTDLQSVLALLKHASPDIQKSSIYTATSLIRRNLIEYFHELSPDVRKKLSTIMESLHPQIIEEISKDIYCDEDQRRLRAVQILGLLRKNPKVRDVLADLVKDRDVKIRATAINLLGKLVGPNEQQIILSLLNDSDKRVRANTVEALESLGNKRLVPILLRFRKDPSNRIRGNVLKALYNLGHTGIDEDIYLMLESEDDFMKASALWVISQINLNSKKIESIAAHCIISDSDMVSANAVKALKSMNNPRAQGFIQYLGPR